MPSLFVFTEKNWLCVMCLFVPQLAVECIFCSACIRFVECCPQEGLTGLILPLHFNSCCSCSCSYLFIFGIEMGLTSLQKSFGLGLKILYLIG